MTIEDLALLFTRGIGSRGAAHLVDYFGSAEALYCASRAELEQGAGLRSDLADSILRKEGMAEAEREIAHCRKHNICAIAATDADYPPQLHQVVDRPHILFVKGNVEALGLRMLSMVGTREISPSGAYVVESLVGGLANVEGLCVVSGLAFGVDAACHRAALHNGLRTVAVIASPLPQITPSTHQRLADQIVDEGGAIVSELHSSFHSKGNLYIARNRIIAALGEGTLVVESPASGGSLATAGMADSYGRVVMAVPGRVSDANALGTNNLIRSGRARLVVTARDIIEDLGWERYLHSPKEPPIVEAHNLDDLTPTQRRVYAAFDTSVMMDYPQLLAATSLTMGELSMVMLDLELKGLIRALPGKQYEKI